MRTVLPLLPVLSFVVATASCFEQRGADGSGGAAPNDAGPSGPSGTNATGTGTGNGASQSTSSSSPATSGSTGTGIDFTPGEVPAEAPDWVAELVPGTWKAISTNVVADVDPANDPAANPNYPGSPPWGGNEGQRGLINDWCGGALAYGLGTYGSLLVFGGGHSGYYGNEVYAFDLGTRAWARLSNPYPTPSFDAVDAYPDGAYPDGSPVPPHTTDRVEYHPGTNSFVTLEAEVNNYGGYLRQIPYLFSLDQRTWRRGPENPSVGGYMGFSAHDTKRDVIWMIPGASGFDALTAFDPNGDNGDGTFGTWTSHAVHRGTIGSVAAYDATHDLVVVTHFRDSNDVVAIDAANPDADEVVLTQTGDLPSRQQAHGWEWSKRRNAFVFWSGDGVYELYATGDWRTDPWAWRNIVNPENAVMPDYNVNGVFSRFRIVDYAGLEVAVTVNDVEGAVYAFRIP